MEYAELPLFLDIKNSLIDFITYNSNIDQGKRDIILGANDFPIYEHAFYLMNKRKNGANGSYEIERLLEGMKEHFKDEVLADMCEKNAGGRSLTLQEMELYPEVV